MDFLSLPNELLLDIIKICDFPELGRLCQVSRQLDACINSETVWKHKWEYLEVSNGYNNIKDGITRSPCYKSMCHRHVTIHRKLSTAINSNRETRHQTPPPKVNFNQSDILSMDFGSKTTWLKQTRGQWSRLQQARSPSHRPRKQTMNTLRPINAEHQTDTPSLSSCPVSSVLEQEERSRSRKQSDQEPAGHRKPTTQVSEVLETELSNTSNTHVDKVLGDSSDRREDRGCWLPDLSLPQGPFLCTCVTCEPRVSPAQCILRPTTCLHAVHKDTDPLTATNTESPSGLGWSSDDILTMVQHLMDNTGHKVEYGKVACQLTEPTGWSPCNLHSLIKTIYEGLGATSLCLVPKAVCIAMTYDMAACLVVDSGAHYTQVSVVVDQRLITTATQTQPVGGAHISECLAQVMNVKGIKVCACQLDGRSVKEKCHLWHRASRQPANNPQQLHVRSSSHPEGWCLVTLTEELSLAPEVMYLTLNIPAMIQKALAPLTFDLQKRLVANILLTGGNGQLTGLDRRLQCDLQTTLTQLAPWVWVRSQKSGFSGLSGATHDAVEGVSYLTPPGGTGCVWGRPDDTYWPAFTTREDYIKYGAQDCLDKMQRFWKSNLDSS